MLKLFAKHTSEWSGLCRSAMTAVWPALAACGEWGWPHTAQVSLVAGNTAKLAKPQGHLHVSTRQHY